MSAIIGFGIGFIVGAFAIAVIASGYMDRYAEALQARLDGEQARRLQAAHPVAMFRAPDVPDVLDRAQIVRGKCAMMTEVYSVN